jgi:hypothetical protein
MGFELPGLSERIPVTPEVVDEMFECYGCKEEYPLEALDHRKHCADCRWKEPEPEKYVEVLALGSGNAVEYFRVKEKCPACRASGHRKRCEHPEAVRYEKDPLRVDRNL